MDGNISTRWLEGVSLGVNRSSNTYVVATDDGVVSCRSLYRKPIENRWVAESIMELKSTPWVLRERAQLQAELRSAPALSSGDPPAKRTEGPLPKAFRIGYADLVEQSFSEGFAQCEDDPDIESQQGSPGPCPFSLKCV